jgi:hypothetical protein
MSFTRFHDDPNRIQKTNLERSAINDYTFNVPGNTKGSHFFYDPHIRSQKNGVPLYNTMVNVESTLKNIGRPLYRDNLHLNQYQRYDSYNGKVNPTQEVKTITNESRASHPAWTYRVYCPFRKDYLFYDAQSNISIPFDAYLDTNILEKDYYNIKHSKKI